MEDDLNGRRPQWKTTSMENDLNGTELGPAQPQLVLIILTPNIYHNELFTNTEFVSLQAFYKQAFYMEAFFLLCFLTKNVP